MNIRICLSLLMLYLLPLAANAADAPAASSNPPAAADSDPIGQFLKGQSFSLGYSYAQGTFKMSRADGTTSQLTDNGRASPIINYTTGEWALEKFPMKYGDAVIGVNLGGSFGEQNTHFQLTPTSSAVVGQDQGSKVTGDYLSVAPLLYLRLGPIYPGSDSYWLFGYGPGVALYHFSGNPIFYTPQGNTIIKSPPTPVSSSATLFLYQTWRWQFHYGNWDVLFTGKQLSGRKVNGYDTSYEDYSLGLAYTFRF